MTQHEPAIAAVSQPLKESGHFSRPVLRNKGAPSVSCAIDFWLDPDVRSVTVGTARQFEKPGVGIGKATSESPCRFEGLAFDVVE